MTSPASPKADQGTQTIDLTSPPSPCGTCEQHDRDMCQKAVNLMREKFIAFLESRDAAGDKEVC